MDRAADTLTLDCARANRWGLDWSVSKIGMPAYDFYAAYVIHNEHVVNARKRNAQEALDSCVSQMIIMVDAVRSLAAFFSGMYVVAVEVQAHD